MEKNYHYYSENQDGLESDPHEFKFLFHQHEFKFHTDSGVFSKNYIDYGSFVMLKNFIPNEINLPILDMGSGYGPIGIVVSKLYEKEVYMCEINERAFALSQKNVKENRADLAHPLHSNLFEQVEGMQFSSVITNPPIRAGKAVVHQIYKDAYTHLSVGGELWVVIQKKQGAPSSKECIESIYGNCEIVTKDKGYYILKAIKRN